MGETGFLFEPGDTIEIFGINEDDQGCSTRRDGEIIAVGTLGITIRPNGAALRFFPWTAIGSVR